MSYSTDIAEFKKWYEKFHTTYGGFKINDKWVKKVEESHEALRKKIGGVRVTMPIELKDVVPAARFDSVDKLTHELLVTIPQYFYDYTLTRQDFCLPSLSKGDHAGTKFGKHIQTWMKRAKMDAEVNAKVAKIMSSLGEVWARSKTEKITLYVCLTTDPKAFCMIGHYGLDNESCFRQNGCNQNNKYIIGQSPNSYVLLVSRAPEGFETIQDRREDNYPLLSRFWGAANDDLDTFGVVNWYHKKAEPEGNIFAAVQQFFGKLMDCEDLKRHENKIKVAPVYQNKVVNWSFCKKDKLFTDQTCLMINKYMGNSGRCPVCNETYSHEDDFVSCDGGERVCTDCGTKLSVCEHSKTKTRYPLVSAFGPDKKAIMVSSKLLETGVYIKLKDTVYHSNLLVRIDDGSYTTKDDKSVAKCTASLCNRYVKIHKSEGKCKYCVAKTSERPKVAAY